MASRLRFQRIKVTCDCCGLEWSALASTYIFGAKSYCDDCNRPAFEPELKPCDHLPWRRRFNAILRRRKALVA